jgi:hypothetical protein
VDRAYQSFLPTARIKPTWHSPSRSVGLAPTHGTIPFKDKDYETGSHHVTVRIRQSSARPHLRPKSCNPGPNPNGFWGFQKCSWIIQKKPHKTPILHKIKVLASIHLLNNPGCSPVLVLLLKYHVILLEDTEISCNYAELRMNVARFWNFFPDLKKLDRFSGL